MTLIQRVTRLMYHVLRHSRPPQVSTLKDTMPAQSGWMRGVVKEVLSGDMLVIMGATKGGPPPEKRLTLSSLQAPRLVSPFPCQPRHPYMRISMSGTYYIPVSFLRVSTLFASRCRVAVTARPRTSPLHGSLGSFSAKKPSARFATT